MRRLALTAAAAALLVLGTAPAAAAGSATGLISGERFVSASPSTAVDQASITSPTRHCPAGFTQNDPVPPQSGSPAPLGTFAVSAGTVVTIQNLDPIPHSAVSDCSLNSAPVFVSNGPVSAGALTFTVPATLPRGTYTFHCGVHPFMYGVVEVS